MLGNIAHEFREQVGTHRNISRHDAEALWVDIELHAIKDAIDKSDTHSPPPETSKWYNYPLTRARSIELATEPSPRVPAVNREARTSVYFEKRIIPTGSPVMAIIDLLIMQGDWALIKDLKTGRPKADHSDQVLFYASVFNDEYQRWPAKLSVEYLGSHEIEVSMDESKARSLTDEAINRRDLFNLRAQRGQRQFAKPSPTNCYDCKFRPICGAYIESGIVRDNDSGIAGTFLIKKGGITGESYRATSLGGECGVEEYVLVMPENSQANFASGEVIAITGLSRINSSHTLRLEWNASFWRL